MIKEIIEKRKIDFETAVERFKEGLLQIRTGRAHASLVEDLPVDYYGAKAPVKQVASISIPEPRQILISPWNKDDLVSIEKAVRESALNLNPINDGESVRITLPPLNEERRQELVKLLNQKAEETRIKIRTAREEAWDEIQELQHQGKIAEDDKFRGKERLQEAVDSHNKQIEEIRSHKEKEIMTT